MNRIVQYGASALIFAGITACAVVPDQPAYGTIYLVRHAEKGPGTDPSLTDAGWARAERLATELSDAGLSKIWSTNTTRTLQTAGKVSEMTGVSVSQYDAADLPTLAENIAGVGGVHLVVGHSNTVPPLVDLLADDPEPDPMDEPVEYDRLYTVRLFTGWTETDLERY